MFIAALFTTAKLWKQPRCPSTYVNVVLYTMEFYSATKKMKFCHLQVNGWNWRISLVRPRRPKIMCYPSCVDYRPKTNAVILLDIGPTLREERT
jgi:hypothetical protein